MYILNRAYKAVCPVCCDKVLEGVQLQREAGHAEIAPRLSLPCQDHPFGAEIGLGSCLIFITSPMHRKNAEGILKRETADKTHNLISSKLLKHSITPINQLYYIVKTL